MHIEDLLRFNYHWQSGVLEPSTYPLKRKLFHTLKKQIDTRFILTISGLRRTGKSVLQQHLIDVFHTLHPTLSPQHILKFSFETEDQLDLLPSSELDALLNLYFKAILKQHPQQLKQKILIAMDEIQNVRHWQSVIKTYYDLNENIKFILTGSSALYLQEGAESLVGRILDFHLPCLNFEEFLQFTEHSLKLPFCQSLDDLSQIVPLYLTADVLECFEQFLMVGGFPDTVIMFKNGINTVEILTFIRESIVQRIVYKDLRKYFNLQHTFSDKRLMEIFAAESGNFVSNKNLAAQVGLSEVSVKKHIDVFEQSSLIHLIPRFDKKLRRQIQATRKIVVTSPSIMFALSHKPNLEDRAWVGHAAETYACNQLRSYTSSIFVEKNSLTSDEIDFYLPQDNLLIECKYSPHVDSRNFKYLKKQSTLLKAKPIVLTQDTWLDDLVGFPLFLL